MSTTSPPTRRATYTRNVPDHLTRTTRSMARISDASASQNPHQRTSHFEESRRKLASSASSSSRLSSRTSHTARLQTFDPESPEAKPIAQMDSPKKGRFDDFEFELEDSVSDIPVRRKRIETPTATAQDPPSYQSVLESRSYRSANTALTTSRKENTPAEAAKQAPNSSALKPVIVPRASRLTAPYEQSNRQERSTSLLDPEKRAAAPAAVRAINQETSVPHIPSRQLTFTATHSPVKKNPFTAAQRDVDSLARLGESRHSPIKRSQVKPEFVVQPPERSDRKPINMLDLKPSPGKAQRGIFRHNFVDDDDDDDDAEVMVQNDEIKPISRFSLAKAAVTQGLPPVSIPSRGTSSNLHDLDSASGRSRAEASATQKAMSAETRDALASLEASLTRLSSKVRKTELVVERDAPRRVLGDRASMLPSGRTRVFASSTGVGESSNAGKTLTEQSGDDSLFKRPVGRVSALSKSRQSSSQLSTQALGSTSVLQSDASFETASGIVEASDPAGGSGAAQSYTNVVGQEARRKAALQAARRKSAQSFLSAGMPPPMVRKPVEQTQSRPPVAASGSDDTASTISANAEARKEAREARRRSLYTYVPTKKEDVDFGDRSVGNVSASMVICAAGPPADADGSIQSVKRTRFLRGLTVLVDVRDQDGEDASARWVEMLKNAGAKVMLRFGERKLTHIVYKSGRPSTLHSYRALSDPKPHVVGISWVVKCLEEGKSVDEEPYLVEVAKQAIFTNVSDVSQNPLRPQTNKIANAFSRQQRRLSMAPKQAPVTNSRPRERE